MPPGEDQSSSQAALTLGASITALIRILVTPPSDTEITLSSRSRSSSSRKRTRPLGSRSRDTLQTGMFEGLSSKNEDSCLHQIVH